MTDTKYISSYTCNNTLAKMQMFHEDMCKIFSRHNMDFLENLGRRNIVMSQVMEAYFAREIAKDTGLNVTSDGGTGKADIVVEDTGKEIECKLNTPHGKRSHALQADWTALEKKDIDYLYLIANPEFTEFAVLQFENMTQEYYHPPARGSRNKVRMRLDKAMERCTVHHGHAININDREIQKIDVSLFQLDKEKRKRLLELGERIRNCSEKAVATREKLLATTAREKDRFDRKRQKLLDRRQNWETSTTKWSFELAPVGELGPPHRTLSGGV